MEKKKVAFVDFWGSFVPEKFQVIQFLREKYDVEITDMAHADYVFYSDHGDSHWFAPADAVKIYFTIENLAPDFNACDYAIGFEWLQYDDRYLRFPLYYLYPNICELMESKHEVPVSEVHAMKTAFCSITVSNANRDPMFSRLFDALSQYKQVDSGGLWKNNMGGRVPDKLAFDRAHKFSIVCENSAHPGYTTEKIVQAFAAGCVPVYWGDPAISRVFNPKALINVSDFDSLAALVEYVRQVDSDDTLFDSYLRQPALADAQYAKARQMQVLRDFIANIFDVPLEHAYRRNRTMWGRLYTSKRQRQASSWSYIFQEKVNRYVWKVKQYLRKRKVSKNDHLSFPALPT